MFKRLIEWLYLKQPQNLVYYDRERGVYNRVWYESVALIKFEQETLDIILIDMDNLKKINDTLGHRTGDLLINTLILNIKAIFDEKKDFICKYGGDEFLILTKDTHKIKLLSTLPFKDFSYGVCHKGAGDDFESCFKVADSEMYKMKQKKKEIKG